MDEQMNDAGQVLVPLVAVAGAVVLALLAAWLVKLLVRTLAKRSVIAGDLARRARHPLRAVLVVIGVWIALRVSIPAATWNDSDWLGVIGHLLLIALIGTGTWLVGSLAFVVEDAALSRYRVDVKDNRHARRVRTQVQLLRRITVALLVVIAVAAVLLTFPGVSAFGASLLASAGVLSIVAGLAAQSSLANVFAGLQLAFTDAIRVDDVVIVEDEWGRIEEITLTYVVVHVWDDRRLILPSTYFTQTPFENWTRRAAELLGTVELDVDWQVPVDGMRAELNRLLSETDLWDQRVGILQVTDAVGGVVRLRVLASAVDAPTLFDLRCYLREGLVGWLQAQAPQGLPRTRLETMARTATPSVPAAPVEPAPQTAGMAQDARLFTGSLAAEERSKSFTGPGHEVIEEREEHAAEVAARSAAGDSALVEGAEVESPERRESGSVRIADTAVSARRDEATGSGATAQATTPTESAHPSGSVPSATTPSRRTMPSAPVSASQDTDRLVIPTPENQSWDDSAAESSRGGAADEGTAVLPAITDPGPIQPADQHDDAPAGPPQRRSIRSHPIPPTDGGR